MAAHGVGVIALAIAMATPHAVAGRSTHLPCDQIRKALAAGWTLDQIVAQFNTDTAHVVSCVQPKGHKRKLKRSTPKAEKSPHSPAGRVPSPAAKAAAPAHRSPPAAAPRSGASTP